MNSGKFIDVHTHLDVWDEDTKNRIMNSPVEQYWVMDNHNEKEQKPRHAPEKLIVQAAQDLPDKIIPFGRIKWEQGPEQVEEYFNRGFIGLKAFTPPKPYHADEYLPIYSAAAKFNMPILFHTGIIAHSGMGFQDFQKNRGYGPANMEPAFLATIADLFPELIIIGGHPGFPYTDQTEHNLYYYPNIYHDISGYMSAEWLFQALGKRTCSYLEGEKYFINKLLFATDHCIGIKKSEESAYARRQGLYYFLQEYGQEYIWWDHLDDLFYNNAKRIITRVKKAQGRIN